MKKLRDNQDPAGLAVMLRAHDAGTAPLGAGCRGNSRAFTPEQGGFAKGLCPWSCRGPARLAGGFLKLLLLETRQFVQSLLDITPLGHHI